MLDTDYPIGALSILLDRDCLPERYYPLVEKKDSLLPALRALGCARKSDAARLSDEALEGAGLEGGEIPLMRRFLGLYDPSPAKLRELPGLCPDARKRALLEPLYYLPGVKAVRADLYLRAGFGTLEAIADATVSSVREATARVIRDENLSCIVPLPKEIRTHIAVARAFLWKE